ncbi:hypothetical protein Tco_1541920 [Tanacetum coccineum]
MRCTGVICENITYDAAVGRCPAPASLRHSSLAILMAECYFFSEWGIFVATKSHMFKDQMLVYIDQSIAEDVKVIKDMKKVLSDLIETGCGESNTPDDNDQGAATSDI